MTSRKITKVICPCGHQGSIVESRYDDVRSHWYLATLLELSHNGIYDGLDALFSETTPACPKCERSLGPEHMIVDEHCAASSAVAS
jgi:hypothetical protein